MSSRRTDDSGGHESWIAFLEGGGGEGTEVLDEALAGKQLVMCPVVLTELLSNLKLHADVAGALTEVPVIDIHAGFWDVPARCELRYWREGEKPASGML